MALKLTFADGVAKQAKPIEAPFVPHTGCRHLPVECFVRKPTRPNVQHGPQRMQPHEVRQQLSHEPMSQLFTTHMDKVLHDLDHQVDSLDQKLLEGWQQCIQLVQPPKSQRPLPTTADGQESFSNHIHQMWQLRQGLRSMPGLDTTAPATALLQQVFAGWRKAATLQAITRKVRKAGRDRKIQKVKQVLDSGDIFKTAKCLAPKTPKRRIQLRDEQGKMQSHDQEHGQLVDYFRQLYDGLRLPPSLLTKPITFDVEEITAAIAKMSPAKVMPSCSAPTVLWKWTSKSAAHILRQQFEHVFQPGEVHIPSAWNVSELVLLPKPGAPLRKPSDLRPISLLPPEMKILSSVIATRVQPQVQTYIPGIDPTVRLRFRPRLARCSDKGNIALFGSTYVDTEPSLQHTHQTRRTGPAEFVRRRSVVFRHIEGFRLSTPGRSTAGHGRGPSRLGHDNGYSAHT